MSGEQNRDGLWGCFIMVGGALIVVAFLITVAWGVSVGMHSR